MGRIVEQDGWLYECVNEDFQHYFIISSPKKNLKVKKRKYKWLITLMLRYINFGAHRQI